ncbi:3-alpha,7-alpha,12-alpha-trihydroxy-5-beta-cholest-24-enoyl-CoA hydratase [Bosea sp. AAP35]|uniref:MaoC family dehydratase n=1 Tax=Bosea sp. AAP35 TaxID=1523417 RepID=UPI0006B9279F|nr:MaoC family dehydratase [Bosea sp. AAP35]KPF72431.1 3-alpha,7-alpha,12-alpha-trihydroxy-5-beta-cholest-24-enoyl-CoA hydratase [Bosea sp. AAP35]
MALDPGKLYALDFPEIRQRYSWRDSVVYALGLGFGLDPLDEGQLAFVDETKLKAVPTMANVLAYPGFWMRHLDTGIDWVKVVHGEQAMTMHQPLPPEGEIVGRTRIVDIVDKGPGKGALVYAEREIRNGADGVLLATLLQTVFCRGDGGFGGKSESPRRPHPTPDRAADLSIALPTHPQLALIYRLSGDLNPLHADPATAAKAGYERPILHGLATYGIAGHALMKALCGYEPGRFRAIDARFSAPVYPGETITTDIWREGEGQAAFRCRVADRDATVIANGRFTYDA